MMILIGKLAKERKIYHKGKCDQQIKQKKVFNLSTRYKILFLLIGHFIHVCL